MDYYYEFYLDCGPGNPITSIEADVVNKDSEYSCNKPGKVECHTSCNNDFKDCIGKSHCYKSKHFYNLCNGVDLCPEKKKKIVLNYACGGVANSGITNLDEIKLQQENEKKRKS